LVAERNKLAAEVQQLLEGVNERLLAMDGLAERLLGIERARDPGAVGIQALGTLVFTVLNSPMRLRPSIAGALRSTSYERVLRPALLTPEEEDFSRIEGAAAQKVIGRLEADLRAVDELSKEEVLA
jgi:hypothetical protein